MNSIKREKNSLICVSGIGMISAAGSDVNANFAKMISGKRSPMSSPSIFSSEITKPVFECDTSYLNQTLLPYRRTFALSIAALNEALIDAGIVPDELKHKRVGICIGTTVACTLNDLQFYSQFRKGESPDILPLKRYLCGDISLSVADLLEIECPTLSVTNACASGTNAIAVGYSWIKSGFCDIVITGGADELNLIPFCGFNSLQVMSDEPCLPFDKRRKGLNLGEGAGILILESLESLLQRERTPEVVLSSCGGGSDAYHITGPHPEGLGLKSAISATLRNSQMLPSDIDYINAHGTATINNDRVESAVFADIFGSSVKYSSIKYFTGHTLAAAGAIEAVICVKGINEGYFPGMVDCLCGEDIPVAPSASIIPYKNGGVLSTSMAFGGSCNALLFKAYNMMENRSAHKLSGKSVNIAVSPLDKNLDYVFNHIGSVSSVADFRELDIRCTGIGITGPFGKGMTEFRNALSEEVQNENKKKTVSEIRKMSIPEDILNTPELKKIRRRADKLSLSMYCTVLDAVENSGQKQLFDTDKCALIVVTPLGAYSTTFKFLDGVIDYGQTAPSPTFFSNSVHNAPAFYISQALNITGPSVTFTGFNHPFQQAFMYAAALLNDAECENVLLVAGDEVCEKMIGISELWFSGFPENRPEAIGEGAVAFILTSSALSSDAPVIKSADLETFDKIERVFGKTLINEAFAMAAEL